MSSRCWILTRADDHLSIGLTEADTPITINGVECQPCALPHNVIYERNTDNTTGSSEIWGIFHHNALTHSDLYANRWAGAQAQLYIDQQLVWQGVVGKIEWNGQQFKLQLQGMLHTLQRYVLRSYLRTCDAVLGDARCGVDLTAYQIEGIVSQVVHRTAFAAQALITASPPYTAQNSPLPEGWQAQPDGVLQNTALPLPEGTVRWLSGLNTGQRSTIRAVDAATGTLSLYLPLPFAVQVGDAFVAQAGCDKTLATCRNCFNNVVNFRGCAYMPNVGTLLQVPTAGDNNDGGV